MKLTIQREDLLKSLQLVSGAVERRQTLPILANVLLSTDDSQQLSMTASDLEIQLQGIVQPDEIATTGETTVNARKLMDICRALPNSACVDLNIDKNRLIVRSGKSRFVLSTLSAAEFPVVEETSGSITFTLPQNKLKKLLEQTYFAMAQQDVRYYLNGMLFDINGGVLRLVATDGHRLSMASLRDIETNGKNVSTIVPRKGILELMRLLDDDEAEIKISIGPNHICATSPKFTLTSKLVEGKFPDYDRVIPKNGDKTIVIDREMFKQALSRVSILSNEKYRGIRMLITPGQMKIFANNPEQEEAEEEVAIEYQGSDLEIGFNVTYLLDVCNVVTDKEIQIVLGDANSSLLIEAMGDSNSIFVVMPMRI